MTAPARGEHRTHDYAGGSQAVAPGASGLSGVLVPVALKRFGFDPATASSIFLTTATDCVSMGMLLLLATILVR